MSARFLSAFARECASLGFHQVDRRCADRRGLRGSLVGILATLMLACGPDEPTVDRTPGVAPASTYFELRVIGGDRTLRAFAEHAGPGAQPFLVGSVRDLIDGVIALPGPVRDRVRSDGELRVLATEGDDGLELALAVPFDAADFEALEPGGPRNTLRPGGAANLAVVPATTHEPAILVAAASAEHLAATLPYLAFASFEPKPEGLHARFPERRFAEDLRPWLERTATELVRQGRASIASERARRDRPPELGDPEIVLDRVATLADRLAALSADLGPTELSLTTDAAGAHLRVTSALADSPLRDVLLASSSVALDAARLPEGTALAVTWPEAELLPLVLALAGERLDEASRAELSAWASRWPSGPRTIALGAAPGRFGLAHAHTANAPTSGDPNAPNEARAPGETRPESPNVERSPRGSRPSTPNGAGVPIAGWIAQPFARAWADALGTCEGGCLLAPTEGRLALGAIPSRTLADDPDAARALRGDALFALVVDGARAAAWLDPTRALDPPAVVVLRARHEESALVFAIDATPGALAPLVGIATSFVD